MKVRILASSSKDGNCVIVDNHFMIDAGLPKKRLETYTDLNEIHYIFITHRHADHANLPFLAWALKQKKRLFIPEDVLEKLSIRKDFKEEMLAFIQIHKDKKAYDIGDYRVIAYAQRHHDIINYAFVIEHQYQRLLYATDLDTLSPNLTGQGLTELGKFDTILLEGNYDELYLRQYLVDTISNADSDANPQTMNDQDLELWVRQHKNVLSKNVAATLTRAIQNMRHLSKQQARAYVKNHLKENGDYYEMHRSSLFYEPEVEV